jgi:hypothetical protein
LATVTLSDLEQVASNNLKQNDDDDDDDDDDNNNTNNNNNKKQAIPLTGPPLWSSGQSSWLQIQRSRFDSRRYKTFWEVLGLERGSLNLVGTI